MDILEQYALDTGDFDIIHGPRHLDEMRHEYLIAILCGSGYRCSIAASMLRKHGAQHVGNIMSGMGARLEEPNGAWHPADLVFPGEAI